MPEMSEGTLVNPRPILRSWQFWIGLAVSSLCLVLALREVNFTQVASIISQINGGWMSLAVASVPATFLAKAMRWRMLFSPDKKPALKPAFTTQSIGMLVNTFAPARLGDLARAYLMGEAGNQSKFYILGTVVVEKIIDLGFLVLMVFVLVTRMILPAWLVDSIPSIVASIIVASVLIGLLVWQGDRLVDFLTHRINQKGNQAGFFSGRWINWLSKKVHLGLYSLEIFRQPGQLFWVLIWTVISWILAVSTNSFVFLALGLRLSVWDSLFLLVVLQAGVAVPSSPGRIGVFHYLTMITLIFLGIEKELALTCGVVLHLVVIGSIGLVGMLCLWWEKVTWNKLSEMALQLNALVRKIL